MQLRARLVADGVFAGMHRSARRGSGVEFAGHRVYVPGDELRCTGAVAAKDADTRRVTLEVRVENQKGEKVFNKGVAELDFTETEEN